MKKQSFLITGLIFSILLIGSIITFSQELEQIKLLPPQTDIGMPLMQALKERKSTREFSSKKLPLQELSNLLWAAFGINRQESVKRTAPTAMNTQEFDIYVANADGLYLYDAKGHILQPILAEDIRAATGEQDFVSDAPLNLIYVSDYTRFGNIDIEDKNFYSATDTGFISQNVYLYCASQGLATVVRGWVNKPKLEEIMKLRPDQKVILAQTVGYPK